MYANIKTLQILMLQNWIWVHPASCRIARPTNYLEVLVVVPIPLMMLLVALMLVMMMMLLMALMLMVMFFPSVAFLDKPIHRIWQRHIIRVLVNLELLTPSMPKRLAPKSIRILSTDLMELDVAVLRWQPLGGRATAADFHTDAIVASAFVGVVGWDHDVAFAAEVLDCGVDVRVLLGAFDCQCPVVCGGCHCGKGCQAQRGGCEFHGYEVWQC